MTQAESVQIELKNYTQVALVSVVFVLAFEELQELVE